MDRLCRARFHLRDLHGGDRVSDAQPRQPALQRRNGRTRFSEGAGRHADSGAAAEVQAGVYGRTARLHRTAAGVSAGALAAGARADARARGLSRALYAGLESDLESAVLPNRRLVLQSARLAT